MKKILLTLLLGWSFCAFAAQSVWVVVKKSTIKSEPSFLSSSLTIVNYQDELELSSKEDAWWKVSKEHTQGWMHSSALSGEKLEAGKKKEGNTLVKALSFFGNISTSEDDGDNGFSFDQSRSFTSSDNDTDEVTLAGKGFNKEIEDIYRQEDESLNYAAVEQMEADQISLESIRQFADNGILVAKQLPSEVTKKSASNSANPLFGDF